MSHLIFFFSNEMKAVCLHNHTFHKVKQKHYHFFMYGDWRHPLSLQNKIGIKMITWLTIVGYNLLTTWFPKYVCTSMYVAIEYWYIKYILTLGLVQDDFVLIIYFRFKDLVVVVFLVVVSIIFLVVGWAHVAKHWDRVKKRLELPKWMPWSMPNIV